MNDDVRWMRRALEEARKGQGRTAPNPAVGAVVVRNGKELGCGWHHKAGQPHAEREAIAAVVKKWGAEALRGATIYVTLEPCSTKGRTGACTEALIAAGFGRVVYGTQDPNPKHAGAAQRVLSSAGIEVKHGVLQAECDDLIRGFSMVQKMGRPWVIWKTAMSLDARLTRPPGEGSWLTGAESRAEVQRIRACCEAIVISGETVRQDLPQLTIRVPELLQGRDQPWRIVVSDHPQSLPSQAPLFTDKHAAKTEVHPISPPKELLERLAREKGVNTVLLECGGKMAGAWLEAGVIDEAIIFMAPLLCGGDVPPLNSQLMPEQINLEATEYHRFGNDVMLRAKVGSRAPRDRNLECGASHRFG